VLGSSDPAMRAFALGLLLVLGSTVSCSSSSSSPASPPLGPWPAGGVPNPGPGNQVDTAFNNVSPNDTPGQATPLGTSTLADVAVWIGNNAIGGPGNASNYFVFRTSPAAGTFGFDGCFTSPITSLDASLWKVVEAQPIMPAVASWSATASDGGPGCLSSDTAPLEASTVYLYGLTATGGAGTYSL
jgi:hypothetical protein